MQPFFVEWFKRALAEMLAARGTTMLGIVLPIIVVAIRELIKAAFERKLELDRKSAAYGVVAVAIVWIALVVYFMVGVKRKIESEAARAIPPEPIPVHVAAPRWADEMSTPSLAVSLDSQNSFSLDLQNLGSANFQYKRQHFFDLSNDGRKRIDDIDLMMSFHYPEQSARLPRWEIRVQERKLERQRFTMKHAVPFSYVSSLQL